MIGWLNAYRVMMTANPAMTPSSPQLRRLGPIDVPVVVGLVVLSASLLWASWPALSGMADRWSRDTRYSHGFLVPLFSVALLWLRKDMATGFRPNGWGLVLVAAGMGMKVVGAYLYLPYIDEVSLLPTLAGVCVLAGGLPCLRWAWPAVAFLVFMVPLPYRLEYLLGGPLQSLATWSSAYALQTIGLPAVTEGNVIHINEAKIGVVEACNGLGMLVMFFAFATAAALLIPRPADKAVILLSAVPISLAANVSRITLTGVLHAKVGGGAADHFYHDLAGWLMMPLALAMLWGELFLLSHLLVEAPASGPAPFDLSRLGAAGRDA